MTNNILCKKHSYDCNLTIMKTNGDNVFSILFEI